MQPKRQNGAAVDKKLVDWYDEMMKNVKQTVMPDKSASSSRHRCARRKTFSKEEFTFSSVPPDRRSRKITTFIVNAKGLPQMGRGEQCYRHDRR